MKFGRNLPRNVVPEWGQNYIKYKQLKKIIKSAAEEKKAGREADLAGEPVVLDALRPMRSPSDLPDLDP